MTIKTEPFQNYRVATNFGYIQRELRRLNYDFTYNLEEMSKDKQEQIGKALIILLQKYEEKTGINPVIQYT